MRFHDKEYQNPRIICVLLLCVFFLGTASAHMETARSVTTVSVSLNVVDETGSPILNALLTTGKGMIHATINETGNYTFQVDPEEIVTISAPGYIKNVSSGQKIIDDTEISLRKADLYMSPEDDVPLPYTTMKKRHATGSYTVIKGDDLSRYPSMDLRLALTGLAPGLQVTEQSGAPGMNPQETLRRYGLTEQVGVIARGRRMMYIIDGIPADITETQLDPQEVESITVIKDIVGKTMFGPLGADGIMLIKTRRGSSGEKYMNVNVERGTGFIDRFPEWVSGTDYARLNNQARQTDGLNPLYNDIALAGYAKNDPYDMRYPNVNFREYMIQNSRSFQRANVSARGGGETVKYSSYLGYNNEGDIFGIGSNSDVTRVNVRSNIDIQVNDYISTELDINGNIGIRPSPGYGYTTSEGQAMMGAYEFQVALPHILRTPPVEFPIYANNDPSLVRPWYGISSRYDNPVGNLLESGNYNEQNRQAGVNSAIKYDMSHLVGGLSARASVGFDVLNLTRIGQANRYEGYRIDVTANDTTLTRVQPGIFNDTRLKLHDHYHQRVSFTSGLNYKINVGVHGIESSLTYFLYRKLLDQIRDPQPHTSAVWMGKYTYNDKYTLQGVLNYASTFSFNKDNRNGLFPALGASWLISEENFMSGLQVINYLKLRAEAGVNGYDPYLDPFIVNSRFHLTTRSNFGPHPLNRWFGTNVETSPSSTYPLWVGNPDLTWEKRREYSIGLDGLMFNHKLSFEVNYYNILRDGVIVRLSNSMPDVTGFSGGLPYVNFNQYRYYGVETGIQLTDRTGGLAWSIGGNVTFQNTEIVRYDEPNYRHDYQFRTGEPVDTYWGLNYIGKFTSDAEALIVPQLFDPVLYAGDLKYKDMNNDGVIDENDYSAIGNTSPRVMYTVNANFWFRNFNVIVVGTGAAFFDIPRTSEYFHNGWGDDNYSAFVRDNVGGDYPRLTYHKVNNNFVPSDFWLVKGDYFKIKNVELAYTIPKGAFQIINSAQIRLFARGANLLTISSVADIDPEAVTSGISNYPLYRTFTGGISLTF
jgi:TonB-linked SusC/RagA family outer membrane protein